MTTTQTSTFATSEMPYALAELAACCEALSPVPESTHTAARRTLLDTIGVAAAGAATRAGRASQEAAALIWGNGGSTLWFSGASLPGPGAAFVNATFAAALDLDDGHRQASGHPAAAIVPAVLATAECVGASASRILTAIVLGYEIAVRISAARDIGRLRTTDSGLWCGFGVAAATAWLMGLNAPVIAHAMAIAGQTATAQAATGWTRLGHTVKEGIPWATANGLQAVHLAVAGHRGPVDMLDDPDAYDRSKLLAGFGQTWTIENAYFKLYSACRWAHAAIDGALSLADRLQLKAGDIDSLLVETFDRALTLPNQTEPQSGEAAQYSIPFCVALALVHGPGALLPMKEMHLNDPQVVSLAKRVRLVATSDYHDAFPASTPARVTMSGIGKRETIEVLTPKGDPLNPLLSAELHEKFLRLAAERPLSRRQIHALMTAASGLGIHQSAEDLIAALKAAS